MRYALFPTFSLNTGEKYMNNILATMCYVDNGESFLMLKRTKKENDRPL